MTQAAGGAHGGGQEHDLARAPADRQSDDKWHKWLQEHPKVVAAISVALLTLAGLQGSSLPSSSDPDFGGGCGAHDGLVVAGENDVSLGSQRRELIRQWNADPNHMRATMVELGPSIDLLHGHLVATQQAQSCIYDVLVLDTPWTAEFAESGFVEEIKNEWMEQPSDFFDPVMDAVKWKDKQYAVPWTTDAGLLYLRSDRPGDTVPTSWDQLTSTGYATQLANYEGLTVNALEVLWNTANEPILSGAVEDEVGEGTAQEMLNALDKLADIARKAPDSRKWNEADTIDAFVDGKSPLMRNWPYVFRALTADPRIGNSFEFRSLPGPSFTVLGGQSLAVSKFSRHKEDAGALIRHLTTRDAEGRLFRCGGYPPTRASALDGDPCPDEEIREDPDAPDQQRRDKFATALRAALQNAHSRPVTPHYRQFSETFRDCVNMVLDGRPPTRNVLADALNAALKGKQASCRV